MVLPLYPNPTTLIAEKSRAVAGVVPASGEVAGAAPLLWMMMMMMMMMTTMILVTRIINQHTKEQLIIAYLKRKCSKYTSIKNTHSKTRRMQQQGWIISDLGTVTVLAMCKCVTKVGMQ